MEKKFTKFELARLKRTAQNVSQFVTKKNRLVAKIAEMQEEINKLQELIDLSDAPIKLTFNGYGVEDLVKKVVTASDKLDNNGNIIKTTSFEFIYPDTIVPPVMEVPCTEGMCGSDFDADSETIGAKSATDETNFNLEAE